MKKTLLLALMSIIIFSCKKEDKTEPSAKQPPTVISSDTGSVAFQQLNWEWKCGIESGNIYQTVGIGYTANDIAVSAYFAQQKFAYTPYRLHGLKVGTYYYKAITSVNTDPCNNFVSKTQTGSFTIEANKTIKILIP